MSTPYLVQVEICAPGTGRRVRACWSDGRVQDLVAIWLYDHRPNLYHENGQKRNEPSELDLEVCVREAAIVNAGNALLVTWSDGSQNQFSASWLRTYDNELAPKPAPRNSLWSAHDLVRPPQFLWSDLLHNPQSQLAFLQAVRDFGIGLAQDVPRAPEGLERLIELFGFICETNYGRYFEVRSVAHPENLAYTSLGLSGHTDNPYRDPVPGLQCLLAIRNDAEGGDSTFADGFAVADHLRSVDAEAYNLLADTEVEFRFRSPEVDLSRWAPIIQTDRQGDAIAIHFNSRSIQPLRLPPNRMERFYAAYREFARQLESDRFRIRFRLQPGHAILFDNRRILHGRTGFSHGERHLWGCYAHHDGLYSRIRVLEGA